MSEPSDDMLMRALQSGDEQAFDALLDRHLDAIHRYLLRHLGNAADADELSQETFLRLWTQADSFNAGKSRLTTWLHRIAHNLLIDRTRQSAFRVAAQQTDAPEALTDESVPALSDERLGWLNNALFELPEAQRWALALVYLQGFSNKEAAIVMGVGHRALESLIARGKANLGRQIDE